MKMTLVAVKIILIIVIMVSVGSVLGAIGYVASIKNNPPVAVQPTPTITQILTPTVTAILTPIAPNIDISDWKTYKNENFGYEIKYPKDWELIYLSKSIPGHTGVVLKSPIYQPIKDGNVIYDGEIYISVIDNPNNLSIKDLFATFNDTARFWFDKFDHKDIVINGNRGVLFDNIVEDSSSNIKRIDANIEGGKKVIDISYLFLENPNREIYDKIISTFKFTETANTADWKTYKNEKYGFELIFPSSWKGYIVKTKELELVGTERYDSINFGFDIQNSLFNINIFTKDQWNKLVSSEVSIGRPEPDYINKNEKFFFNVMGAQYTENQEMADRMSEIGNILSTFKFVDETNQVYKLDCTNKPDSFQSKYSWYEDFNNQIGKDWKLDTICYNEELKNIIYFTHYLKGQHFSDELVQMWIYNVKNNINNKEVEMSGSQCRKISKWLKNSDIIYECDSSGPAVVRISTYSYNTNTKNNKLINSCGIGNNDTNYLKTCEDERKKEYFNNI